MSPDCASFSTQKMPGSQTQFWLTHVTNHPVVIKEATVYCAYALEKCTLSYSYTAMPYKFRALIIIA